MEAVKVTSNEQYEELLTQFKRKLLEAIPEGENPQVTIGPAEPITSLQLGASARLVTLITNSSGVDRYSVYVASTGHVEFIRQM